MNGEVLSIAQRLHRALDAIDAAKDRDTLVWAHGFLTGVVNGLPDLVSAGTLLQSTRTELEQLIQRNAGFSPGAQKTGSDSLEQIERELDGLDDAPVPVKRKPGPKGLSGGAVVRLPDSDPPM